MVWDCCILLSGSWLVADSWSMTGSCHLLARPQNWQARVTHLYVNWKPQSTVKLELQNLLGLPKLQKINRIFKQIIHNVHSIPDEVQHSTISLMEDPSKRLKSCVLGSLWPNITQRPLRRTRSKVSISFVGYGVYRVKEFWQTAIVHKLQATKTKHNSVALKDFLRMLLLALPRIGLLRLVYLLSLFTYFIDEIEESHSAD